jgi:hypothetical protein
MFLLSVYRLVRTGRQAALQYPELEAHLLDELVGDLVVRRGALLLDLGTDLCAKVPQALLRLSGAVAVQQLLLLLAVRHQRGDRVVATEHMSSNHKHRLHTPSLASAAGGPALAQSAGS